MQNQPIPANQLNNNQTKRSSYANYNKLQTSTSSSPQQQQQTWPSSLPPGWKREECMRPNGLGTGKSDVYYISPQNQIVRNKQEMQTILGDKYDIASFDWRMGKFNMNNNNKSKRLEEVTADTSAAAKVPRLDNQYNLPVRRCLFSSVTNEIKPVIVRSHPECKRTDVKNTNHEIPHQLFWEKRLADHVAINPDTGEPFKPISLPKGMQCRRIFSTPFILLFLAAGVPGYQPTQLIQSLIHALSSSSNGSNSSPIIGQEQQPSAIEKNPCVIINHLQPMIKTFIVTDDDIRRQEARVKELRKKLETARKKLHPRYETEREG
ncbi:hypothetical protein MN116_005459 [Schistosoma mekongi]|uniref:MBD domain-containing protein n=1 Tax=Schistosoma mekongi TaxID=38744 RepID=A0AAE2D5D2_SCHME|nr:hypothetical protein MN116_005459 [Schistosoma mekongi]